MRGLPLPMYHHCHLREYIIRRITYALTLVAARGILTAQGQNLAPSPGFVIPSPSSSRSSTGPTSSVTGGFTVPVVIATNGPSTTGTPAAGTGGTSGNGVNALVIAIPIVVCALLLAALIGFFVWRKRRQRQNRTRSRDPGRSSKQSAANAAVAYNQRSSKYSRVDDDGDLEKMAKWRASLATQNGITLVDSQEAVVMAMPSTKSVPRQHPSSKPQNGSAGEVHADPSGRYSPIPSGISPTLHSGALYDVARKRASGSDTQTRRKSTESRGVVSTDGTGQRSNRSSTASKRMQQNRDSFEDDMYRPRSSASVAKAVDYQPAPRASTATGSTVVTVPATISNMVQKSTALAKPAIRQKALVAGAVAAAAVPPASTIIPRRRHHRHEHQRSASRPFAIPSTDGGAVQQVWSEQTGQVLLSAGDDSQGDDSQDDWQAATTEVTVRRSAAIPGQDYYDHDYDDEDAFTESEESVCSSCMLTDERISRTWLPDAGIEEEDEASFDEDSDLLIEESVLVDSQDGDTSDWTQAVERRLSRVQ